MENQIIINKELEKIFKYFHDKQYEKSEQLALIINQKYPDNISILKVLAEIFNKTGRKFDSINTYNNIIKLNSSDAQSYFSLAGILSNSGNLKEAKFNYEKAIALRPDHAQAYNNLGSVYRKLGILNEAVNNYKKALILKFDYSLAYNNLAVIQQEIGNIKDSEINYLKAIKLEPNHKEIRLNLAIMLYFNHQYKKAVEHFKLIDSAQSNLYLLRCAYFQNEKLSFSNLLNLLIAKGENNAVIGSFTKRASIRYGVKIPNPFCAKPLNYVFKKNLKEICNFKNTFVEYVNTVLNSKDLSYRKQKLLTNGRQTSNDLFDEENTFISEIRKIIILEIENYRNYYEKSEEGFIKNWPKFYKLTGWIVSMKNSGSLSAHMHDSGWLSGSIYINVPHKSKNNSGNLVVSTDYKEEEKNFIIKSKKSLSTLNENKRQEKIIDVVTGDMCLFPSSLLHHTIPFESSEERIVLAFDVIKSP